MKSSPTNRDIKPRLILKVKFNSPITKRKRNSNSHTINRTNVKRKKIQVIETPISPVILTETNSSLPRLKTTQQLLLEMQMNEPSVLSTQTSTVNAILQKKIIDESLHQTIKFDYSALHHGRDFNHINTKLVIIASSSLKKLFFFLFFIVLFIIKNSYHLQSHLQAILL
jgi:hypothetical protein